MRSRIWLTLAMVALAATGLVIAACGGPDAGSLAGTTLQGETFDLAQAGGKPTVVNFFASWCGPCNAEAEALVAFAKAHPEVQFVGVATNDQQANVEGFVTQYKMPYTIVMDADGAIAGGWGVNGIPTTFFLDADGDRQASIVGSATAEQFEEQLKTIQ